MGVEWGGEGEEGGRKTENETDERERETDRERQTGILDFGLS